MKRLTRTEWNAIAYALDVVLAAPCLDGIEEESDEERRMYAALRSASSKAQERL